jgi:endogenous inhibitor of DNA gyrase (YacG/DUF329 family)
MANYENPANGRKVTVGSLGPFLGALFFGCFYFLVKGSTKHFLGSALLAICTAGVSWLIYPFFAPGIIRKMYEDKGFVRMSGGSVSSKSGMKKCPHCAEYVKRDAQVCRHCGNSLTSSGSTSSSGKRAQIKKRSEQPTAAAPVVRAVRAQSITVECPYCQKTMTVTDASSGSTFSCPHCQQSIEIQ